MRLGILLLLLSLLMGGFAAWQTKEKLDSVDSRKSACFLKLRVDLALGETLGIDRSRGAFVRECFVPDTRLSEIAISDSEVDRQWVAGRAAAIDIPRGVVLLRQFFKRPEAMQFDEKLIPENRRAVTIEVNEVSSVSQFIRPGSIVDVIGVFDVVKEVKVGEEVFQQREGVARTILQDVEVLAAGRVTSGGGYSGLYERGLSYRSVTLNVTPEQAELLVFGKAQSKAGLVLSLRRKDDRGQKVIEQVDFNVLVQGD